MTTIDALIHGKIPLHSFLGRCRNISNRFFSHLKNFVFWAGPRCWVNFITLNWVVSKSWLRWVYSFSFKDQSKINASSKSTFTDYIAIVLRLKNFQRVLSCCVKFKTVPRIDKKPQTSQLRVIFYHYIIHPLISTVLFFFGSGSTKFVLILHSWNTAHVHYINFFEDSEK